jgi:hypothetical protein
MVSDNGSVHFASLSNCSIVSPEWIPDYLLLERSYLRSFERLLWSDGSREKGPPTILIDVEDTDISHMFIERPEFSQDDDTEIDVERTGVELTDDIDSAVCAKVQIASTYPSRVREKVTGACAAGGTSHL